ncbi:candidate a-glycosidase, possible maltooligosyl trehalose synthase, Glycoside Hydrolase Family 13 protein [Pedobacter sp. BAL39]|uniref:malto-oligosyltrehalose synthase n=1 Tax=Pedobacter sp. BAL39 TaxID=391596 RepID=UPI0001559636|nr:malto-oligosyltrehalose synthase [Pedobacter sp. BAL39]EDM36695.1 candidate a-glycosidase, possible maltooligosyl trehalose synthase, Glycoside Hydrolase Family 13 protein [Pedobacter sp. BAL39]
MFKPRSTYRIQFHQDFNFEDFERIIPYLQELGVDTIYASPIFQAVPGSMHGYDITNVQRINPEIGTERQLLSISKKLKASGINWVQDIVPNHMAFHPANEWLMDVLEQWDHSPYRNFFDIRFPNGLTDSRLMVPFLGESLEKAVEKGLLKISHKNRKPYLSYYDSYWPLNQAGITLLNAVSADVNLDPQRILDIARVQHYRLCAWQETDHQINFRRFFTVNGLICLNIQNDEVFEACHAYIFSLMKKGIFQGLRIDHIDGLYDPGAYLYKLRQAVGEHPYIVVEKILEKEEELPANWPVQGTTGYDFLALLNNLFTNVDAERPLTKMYKNVTGKSLEVNREILKKKRFILDTHMQGELDNLCRLFMELDLYQPEELDDDRSELIRKAIAAFLIYCPVYRFYDYGFPLKGEELKALQLMLEELAKEESLRPAGNLLKKIFLEDPIHGSADKRKNLALFYQRCMQFSGPLMAKGVEDTLMYTYNRFAGHNEVGDAQDLFGITTGVFHEKMIKRQRFWPLSMNGTATHDTKRGEDIRARLNVLTDLPDEWRTLVQSLEKTVHTLKPDANDSYLIYQTILGALPMPGQQDGDLEERLKQYLEKALREAKSHTDWSEPAQDYEQIAKDFATTLLENTADALDVIKVFLDEIADFGIVNSLVQLLLKFTCPGIPDVYQGNELWDLSLVDPDNRRPVDYQLRERLLIGEQDFAAVWEERGSGQVKLWLTQKLMILRKTNEQLFAEGVYIPLKVRGRYHKQLLAFARRHQNSWLVAAVPIGLAAICRSKNTKLKDFDWKDTHLILPDELCENCADVFTGLVFDHRKSNGSLLVSDLFANAPLAVLTAEVQVKKRGAGILMPLSSLPSAYGIGDMGPQAFAFADFLAATHQKYWQLLPLNPTGKAEMYSPYSAYSAMAGFNLMISPECLQHYGLLDDEILQAQQQAQKSKINYKKAVATHALLLDEAYQNFNSMPAGRLQLQFHSFQEKEGHWLNDFSYYTVLKAVHDDLPWYQWPDAYKYRDKKVLTEFIHIHTAAIHRVKWEQFIFFEQWHQLKGYANSKGIKLIGDLPFYVGYDSADVWANPKLFALDKEMNITGVAGVPPDYFNVEGQLWGMPVFNWKALKRTGYQWWILRIGKNLELFDLVRLDHFRAFAAYWNVPAGERNAITGSWEPGPGADFFAVIAETFERLPFIAEDLGEIDDRVYALRDEFKLPGMKVLQFAFGDDMPSSPHIPPNYASDNCVVYTGTHDNNTIQGWYGKDITDVERKNLDLYIGRNPSLGSVHEVLIRIAYTTVAATAIIPMQDLLGLDEKARINDPGVPEGNWGWRMKPGMLTKERRNLLRLLTRIYGRD